MAEKMNNSLNQENNKAVDELKQYVSSKPIVLFDFNYLSLMKTDYLSDESVTFARQNGDVYNVKKHRICLFDSKNDKKLYIGIISKKKSITTFETSIEANTIRLIEGKSFKNLCDEISDTTLLKILNRRIPEVGGAAVLSAKVSEEIIRILSQKHINCLLAIVDKLMNNKKVHPITRTENNALNLSLKIFGLGVNDKPKYVEVAKNEESHFARLYEDNVIYRDATQIEGFERIGSLEYTGKAVFRNKETTLTVFTANRLPLEKALGVDLIYFNDTQKSIIMVQYKIIEKERIDNTTDWIFRPDKNFDKQLSSMQNSSKIIETRKIAVDDYRMCSNPFFFKFVPRYETEDYRSNSICLSLKHIEPGFSRNQSAPIVRTASLN